MSLLRIQHRTVYEYSRPLRFSRHRLVLRPREGHDLRVLSLKLQIEPDHCLTWTRDVFGNSIAMVDLTGESSRLMFLSDVLVERWAPSARPDLGDEWNVVYPVTYDDMETTLVAAYQSLTYPQDAALVKEWLDQHIPVATRVDTEQLLSTLCSTIKVDIAYRRRSEKGVQNPATTLQSKQGSCRDLATLMLEAVRVLGIAGRFASGYLHCAASDAGQASTHAWMEAYLPGIGWRGFDPTLGEPASEKHIPTGLSYHPRGVMPVSGQYIGSRSDFLSMSVQVATTAVDEN